jgi:hypothetical protein
MIHRRTSAEESHVRRGCFGCSMRHRQSRHVLMITRRIYWSPVGSPLCAKVLRKTREDTPNNLSMKELSCTKTCAWIDKNRSRRPRVELSWCPQKFVSCLDGCWISLKVLEVSTFLTPGRDMDKDCRRGINAFHARFISILVPSQSNHKTWVRGIEILSSKPALPLFAVPM